MIQANLCVVNCINAVIESVSVTMYSGNLNTAVGAPSLGAAYCANGPLVADEKKPDIWYLSFTLNGTPYSSAKSGTVFNVPAEDAPSAVVICLYPKWFQIFTSSTRSGYISYV